MDNQFIISSYFYDKFIEKSNKSPWEGSHKFFQPYKAEKKVLKWICESSTPLDASKIYIPINIHSDHWVLLVRIVDLKNSKINFFYFDCLA